MSATTIAYHLRPNKAVDRHIFFDLLGRVRTPVPISAYTYVGFGGPFLEDFRHAHTSLGIRKLISLEVDEEVYKRQIFNRPMSCIRCRHQSSLQFVDSFDIEGNCVIWLDYASPRDLRVQLQEVRALLPKLRNFDILKVTLNATAGAVRRTPPLQDSAVHLSAAAPAEQVRAERLRTLERTIGDFLPHGTEESTLTKARYPKLLFDVLVRVFDQAMRASPGLTFHVISSFSYADSEHTMLTVTGVVLEAGKRPWRTFLRESGLERWDFRIGKEDSPRQISMPVLSARERISIESALPRNLRRVSLARRLPFRGAEDAQEWTSMLDSYADFYRHYPHFARVIL